MVWELGEGVLEESGGGTDGAEQERGLTPHHQVRWAWVLQGLSSPPEAQEGPWWEMSPRGLDLELYWWDAESAEVCKQDSAIRDDILALF